MNMLPKIFIREKKKKEYKLPKLIILTCKKWTEIGRV